MPSLGFRVSSLKGAEWDSLADLGEPPRETGGNWDSSWDWDADRSHLCDLTALCWYCCWKVPIWNPPPPIAYKHQWLAPATSKPAASTQVRASRPTGLRVRLASSMPTVQSPTVTERYMHLSTQGNHWSISVWWSEGSVLLSSLRPLIQDWEM